MKLPLFNDPDDLFHGMILDALRWLWGKVKEFLVFTAVVALTAYAVLLVWG